LEAISRRCVQGQKTTGRVPYPHQEAGARFLLDRPGAILADEQGVGKTDTAVHAVLQGGLWPCLVICPANVRVIWARVFGAVAPWVKVVLPGLMAEVAQGQVVIVSFNRLAEWHAGLAARSFAVLIVDEAHLIRNAGELGAAGKRALDWSVERGLHHSMHRTEAALEIARGIPVIWALTGTPILSRPVQLFNVLRLIRHPLALSFGEYAAKYCAGGRTIYGVEASGCSRPTELRAATSSVLLRRRKADVLELPPKEIVRLEIPLTGEARERYMRVWSEHVARAKALKSINGLRRLTGAKAIAQPTLMREVLSNAKTPYILGHGLRRCGQGKTVFLSNFRSSLDLAARCLDRAGVQYVVYHGGMTEKAKAKAVDAFAVDVEKRWFLGNSMSAMVGISLTAADRLYFGDMFFTSGDHDQAADRIHRIGQTKPVTVYYGVCPETIDELQYRLLEESRKVVSDVMDGSADEQWLPPDIEDKFLDSLAAV
jgi:SWI/SNF-related matrix-associated actin-dependent regulator of chromatin subfamily A-like protein 1